MITRRLNGRSGRLSKAFVSKYWNDPGIFLKYDHQENIYVRAFSISFINSLIFPA